MPRELKVYGWQGFRHGRCTREIVAARSQAEVMRITGETRSWLFNLSETRSSAECEQALSEPGAVFWTLLDRRNDWKRA